MECALINAVSFVMLLTLKTLDSFIKVVDRSTRRAIEECLFTSAVPTLMLKSVNGVVCLFTAMTLSTMRLARDVPVCKILQL